MNAPKFAIVVGHTAEAPGAHAIAPLNMYEYEYNKGLADLLSAALMDLSILSKTFLRDNVGILGAYREVNEYEPIGVVELHFNAANGQAWGTETLFVPKDQQSGHLAHIMQSYICGAFNRRGLQDRGWQVVTSDDRGHINLIQAKCPSILTEPFFGDNAIDATLGYTQKNELALSMAQAISIFIKQVQTKN
jgi:N-acetylmuramoyl-L-alanine amidase